MKGYGQAVRLARPRARAGFVETRDARPILRDECKPGALARAGVRLPRYKGSSKALPSPSDSARQ